jgi:hypothetical protein
MLIPKKEAQEVTVSIREEYTPHDYKLELIDGVFLPFNNEREKMLLLCLYNMGLENFVKLLPNESKEILKELLRST